MNTPICDFIKKYVESDTARLHMPGHKGKIFTGPELYDITEIHGADALYEASGIIKQSEDNAKKIFGTESTLYSTEGSSQCIKAMLYLSLVNSNTDADNPVILASRNAHKSFIYACALLDIDIVWLKNADDNHSLCSCILSMENVREETEKHRPFAIYITSPDYSGGMADISAMAKIAHSYGIPLLVDNAHGAYLHFTDNKIHPIDVGADMCSDSAHKTLPVLTGGAYLHVANKKYASDAKKAMALFGSTSPSYLILQSLDMCNKYLYNNYENKLKKCIDRIDILKQRLCENGINILKSDPLRLTIMSSGDNLSEKLRKHGVECEYEDPDFTVMMFTPENDPTDFERVESFLLSYKNNMHPSRPKFKEHEKTLTVRQAILSKSEKINIEKSEGRILASPTVSCPPAVPIVISGERITKNDIKLFKYYGITTVDVVMETDIT